MFIPFADVESDPEIHGFLHSASQPTGDTVVLTHGAGANCQSKLLVGISDALAASGFTVLRFDLPFRRARPHGPPPFGGATKDRDGLRRAVAILRDKTKGRIFLGGHSYGGRQATIMVSEEPQLVDGLLLLSYPLHPPKKSDELRTKHFPHLAKPAFFVHGTRDPFGTIVEIQSALALVPASHALFEVEGVGHDLLPKRAANELLTEIAGKFKAFLDKSGRCSPP
jgi:predicted alpha/beta-hydrolase family hydrolase